MIPRRVNDVLNLAWAQLPDSGSPRLPPDRGVYFIVANTDILYVGATENLMQRWRNHHQSPRARSYKADIYYLPLPADSDLSGIEKALIRRFSPAWNRYELGCDPRLSYPRKADPSATQSTEYLRVAEVAEKLKVEPLSVRRWLFAGKMRGFKVGKEWRITAADLDKFIEANRPHPEGKS